MEQLVEIGKFHRTHALKGELNAILDINPEYVDDGNPLIVDMDGCDVPFYPESVRPKGVTSYLIKLQGVDDADEAGKFVNKIIKGPENIVNRYVDPEEEDGVYLDDMVGYTVYVEGKGYIGQVVNVDDSTANPLLFVSSEEDDGEIIIPAADDFFERIDSKSKEITLSLPPGIIGLNQK